MPESESETASMSVLTRAPSTVNLGIDLSFEDTDLENRFRIQCNKEQIMNDVRYSFTLTCLFREQGTIRRLVLGVKMKFCFAGTRFL